MSQDQIASEKQIPKVLSVEQLNLQIKQILEGQVATVWLKGEISNFKAHTSGHYYFSLKDSKAQISAVMFRGHNSRLKFKPADGVEVIVRGKVSVYETRGNYQIICEMMDPVGAGVLQQTFDKLKEKLKLEGLFDPSRKKAIPHFPRHIAIVTSPTGAAIRDILNILSRRAKGIEVTVVPTIVQGEAAAPAIREALQKAVNLPNVDVVIIGRGGGSIEDMWCFNDEALARLIVASPVPVISAVGHEIDFTIADFVADLRAPTPSAAAELVAKSSSELSSKVTQLSRNLALAMDRKIKFTRQAWMGLSKRLVDPQRKLQDFAQRNDDLIGRLELAMDHLITRHRHRVQLGHEKMGSPLMLIQRIRARIDQANLINRKNMMLVLQKKTDQSKALAGLLDSMSPLRVVDRGYSMVTKNKLLIRSAGQLKIGDSVSVRLSKGHVEAQVTAIKEN